MNPFEKIINLIKKTGDKFIILDKDGEPGYVAMSFSDYEKFLAHRDELENLTEDELLNKINREIAIWKAAQEDQNLTGWEEIQETLTDVKKPSKISQDNPPETVGNKETAKEDYLETEDKYYF